MPGELIARGISVRRGERAILSSVDLEAAPGEITAILGPNGAGKSTLLRAIAGVIRHDGAITLDGTPLGSLEPRARARRMTYLPQKSGLVAGLVVSTIVAQGRYAHAGGLGSPGAADRRAIEAALARADVRDLLDRRFDQLSAGEQRRVLLARALATEARVILLDEPAASLDVRHALELHALLRALAEDGYTVVLVLHELDVARRLTDHAVLLAEGRRVARGPSAEVVTAAHVRAVYGVTLIEGAALGFALPEREGA